MEDFESVVEEYDNNYEEKDTATPSGGEPFPYEEVVTITKVE